MNIEEKARQLVSLVQGTMALEGQAVDNMEEMIEQTKKELESLELVDQFGETAYELGHFGLPGDEVAYEDLKQKLKDRILELHWKIEKLEEKRDHYAKCCPDPDDE
jgi:chaperonin cofactor prefoldin